MSYSSSREAAFRLKAGGILSQRLPGAVWAMCRLVAKLAGVVGSAATFLVAKESMKRRGVVTLRAAGRHAHSEGQEGAARRFEGERLGRRAASGHWRWRARVLEGPPTRHQRCWLHKTLNVLDKLPKSMQPNAHKDLREIWLSPNRGAAEAAMTIFAEKYAPKYDKAVECLIKDRQTLLTFFDLPADHWDHLRTSNPIESVFATVKHRTVRMKGALSQDTARLMVFKLVMAASKTWRRLQGQNQLPKVVNGIQFKDGIEAVAEIKPPLDSRRHRLSRIAHGIRAQTNQAIVKILLQTGRAIRF
jgi:Transposase, Mutator family